MRTLMNIILAVIIAITTVGGCFVGAIFGGVPMIIFVVVMGGLMIAEIIHWEIEYLKEKKAEKEEP